MCWTAKYACVHSTTYAIWCGAPKPTHCPATARSQAAATARLPPSRRSERVRFTLFRTRALPLQLLSQPRKRGQGWPSSHHLTYSHLAPMSAPPPESACWLLVVCWNKSEPKPLRRHARRMFHPTEAPAGGKCCAEKGAGRAASCGKEGDKTHTNDTTRRKQDSRTRGLTKTTMSRSSSPQSSLTRARIVTDESMPCWHTPLESSTQRRQKTADFESIWTPSRLISPQYPSRCTLFQTKSRFISLLLWLIGQLASHHPPRLLAGRRASVRRPGLEPQEAERSSSAPRRPVH